MKKNTVTESQKVCFGDLDRVFPMGKEGLREVPSDCFECPEKTPCLKTALDSKKGVALRSEVLERVPVRGFVGRLKRWSEKKALNQLMKQKEGKKK